MTSLTVKEFLEMTATASPASGGGAVAALTGSAAAALVSMVGELTVGRKRYRDVEEEVIRLRYQAVSTMEALQKAAIEDADAYQAYLNASAMLKDDDGKRELHSREVSDAVVRMTRAPLATAEHCAEVLVLARQLGRIGSMHAISDIGVALHLAHAALQSALMMVDCNLPFLSDAKLEKEINTRRKLLSSDAVDHFNGGLKDLSERN